MDGNTICCSTFNLGSSETVTYNNPLFPVYVRSGMITYIEGHFTQRITLENIASAGTCCKSRCSLLFKKYLRETPMTYIAKLRLQKSLAALLDSDKSLAEIAHEYGFSGASYYCETFRKYYGVSPLKCRKVQTAFQGIK